jgi:hypothetical protein
MRVQARELFERVRANQKVCSDSEFHARRIDAQRRVPVTFVTGKPSANGFGDFCQNKSHPAAGPGPGLVNL